MGGLLASLLGALVISIAALFTLYFNSGIGFSDPNDFKLVKVFLLSNTTTGKISTILTHISAEYMFLYIGRYKTLHISGQYKPQA